MTLTMAFSACDSTNKQQQRSHRETGRRRAGSCSNLPTPSSPTSISGRNDKDSHTKGRRRNVSAAAVMPIVIMLGTDLFTPQEGSSSRNEEKKRLYEHKEEKKIPIVKVNNEVVFTPAAPAYSVFHDESNASANLPSYVEATRVLAPA